LRPEKIIRPQTIHCDESYNIQQIPWQSKLGVRREDARMLRDAWYYPYTNLDFSKYNVCIFFHSRLNMGLTNKKPNLALPHTAKGGTLFQPKSPIFGLQGYY